MMNPHGNYTDSSAISAIERSREASRERDKGRLDYTDLEGKIFFFPEKCYSKI
jgi:hypothetical protein